MSSNPAPLPLTVALPGGQQGYFKVHPRRYVKQPDGTVALLEEPKPLHDGSTVADLILAVSTAHMHSWQWGALLHIAGSPDPLPASAGLWDLLTQQGVSAFVIHPAALPLTVKLPGGEQEGTFPVYKQAPVQQADGTVVLQAPGPLHDGSFVADLILLVSSDTGIAHNWEWGALLHIAGSPNATLPNSAKLWDLLTTQGQSAFGIRPAPAPAVPDELRTLTLSALATGSSSTPPATATVRVLLVSVNTDKSNPLAVDAEAFAVIKKLQRHRHIHCRLEEDITLAALCDILADYDPHAVHIMCHSTQTELKFPGSTAGAQLLAGDLSAALQRAPSCKLLVLNACSTATLASHVLDAGAATVVVSTTQRVRDVPARAFVVRLWGLLAEGRPIGAAFEDAIRQLPVAWRVAHQVGMAPAPPPPAIESSDIAPSAGLPGPASGAEIDNGPSPTTGSTTPPPTPAGLHERLLRHSEQQRANDAQWQLCRPFLVAPVVRNRLEETADHTALFPLWEASVLAHAAQVAAQKHDPTATTPPLPTKGFALYGSPGSGKSTCMLRFEELVWERFDAATHPVLPVRLLLSQVAANDADPVRSHLINKVGYSEAEVEELKQHHSFVILLDGFDEMKLGQHLMTEQLVGYGGSIVVSGRLQSLREFQLFHGGDGLDERYLCGLDAAQIEGYMRKRQETAPTLTDATIAATLANPALMGFTTTPLMLFMLVDVLLEPGNSSDDQQQLVQRFDLYERFTQRWFDREFRKLVAQKQLAGLPSSDAVLDVSCALSTYAERIALLMFQRSTLEISGEELRAEERAVLAATLHPHSTATLRLRQACPLKTLDGRVYQFVHKSFMEFLVSRQLLHSGGDRAVVKALLGGGRRIQEEPQILLFLHEAWTSGKHARDVERLREHLFAIVPDSASNPELAAASANAATGLNWMQESLSGVAWAGARLQGADLAHGVMAGSDLRGADLRGVSFKEAALYDADVSGARMAGVEFGELPLMKCERQVYSLAMTGSGVVACGLEDGAIEFWDVARQERIGLLTGHDGIVRGVAFSNDGRRLVSGGHDETVRVWDVAERKAIGEPMRSDGGKVYCVAFHPDGRLVALGSNDKTIRFWDAERQVADGEPLTGHSKSVLGVAFSPDGKLLASGSGDKTVRLWDVEWRAAVGEPLTGHTDTVWCVAFSPDGWWLASGSRDSTIRIWDVARREAVGQPLRGHSSHVYGLAFSPDSRRLASGSADATIRVWDAERQQPIGEPLVGHCNSVRGIAYTPDGRRLVSGSGDRYLRVWQVEGREAVGQPLVGHGSTVPALAFSPNGERLASGSFDATVRVWSVKKQDPVGESLGHGDTVYCVALHPDGRRIASGGSDKTICVWDVKRQEAVRHPLLGHRSIVRGLAFSPDGRFLASGSSDQTVRLWSVEQQQQVGKPLRGHTNWVWSVAFSPDGRCIASGSQDKTIRLWSVERHEAIGQPLKGHHGGVTTVAFSPDGRLLASGSKDHTIRLWDVEQRKAVGSPAKGHSNAVFSVAFSSDGRRLVSGSIDRTVRVWGLIQGRELRPLTVIPWCCGVFAASFPPASSGKLAFGDAQGSVVFFEETGEDTWTWTPPQRCSSRGLNAALLKRDNCIDLDPTVARLLDQAGPLDRALSSHAAADPAHINPVPAPDASTPTRTPRKSCRLQ